MFKHGTSHGIAVLFCSIIAAILIKYLEPKLPKLFAFLENMSESILLKLNVQPNELLSLVVITAILAFVWGIFFKISSKN